MVSDHDRRALYEAACTALGRGPADTLMDLLPPLGWADVARSGDVTAMGSQLRGQMAELRGEMAELRGEMAAFKAAMRGEMAAFKAEMRAEMEAFKADVRAEMERFKAEMRAEMEAFKADVRADVRAITPRILLANLVLALTTAMLVLAAVAVAG